MHGPSIARRPRQARSWHSGPRRSRLRTALPPLAPRHFGKMGPSYSGVEAAGMTGPPLPNLDDGGLTDEKVTSLNDENRVRTPRVRTLYCVGVGRA
jgi:hypothetical protein